MAKVAVPAKDHIPTLETAFREQDQGSTGRISLQQFTYDNQS